MVEKVAEAVLLLLILVIAVLAVRLCELVKICLTSSIPAFVVISNGGRCFSSSVPSSFTCPPAYSSPSVEVVLEPRLVPKAGGGSSNAPSTAPLSLSSLGVAMPLSEPTCVGPASGVAPPELLCSATANPCFFTIKLPTTPVADDKLAALASRWRSIAFSSRASAS